MAKMIFVNLPVADVAASTAFYEAIGFTRNAQFSNDGASAMVWTESISFMLLGHDVYATFADKPIGDARTTSTALYALSLDSRDEVDAITLAAVAAGGKEGHDPEDEGFMYSRAFYDLDGNAFGPFHMDVEAARPAMDDQSESATA